MLLILLAGLLGAGCRVPGAYVHNLHQLHEPSGRHARSGKLTSGLGYLIRYGARDLFGQRSSLLQEAEVETFDDPLRACLHNAARLASVDSKDERVATAQVAALAWLAVDCPWNLTRETCVRALGRHGQRLGVVVPPPRTEQAAGPPEVRRVLAGLVAAVRGETAAVAFAPEDVDPEEAEQPEDQGTRTAPPTLESACAAAEALELDREGALRLVRGIGALEAAFSLSDPRAQRLRRTLAELERTLVAETLLLALKDRAPREAGGSNPGWDNPRVRAAAVEACVRAFGDSALGELIYQLDLLDPEDEGPVVQAVLAAVARRGLPAPPEGLAPEDQARLEEERIQRILWHAYHNPEGSVRVAAMRALERISGGALHSLREEDWLEWHAARRAAGQTPPPAEEPQGS